MTARRQAMQRTYDEVKRLIQDRMYRERREAMVAALVARLRASEHVQEDAAALETVRVPEAQSPHAPGAAIEVPSP